MNLSNEQIVWLITGIASLALFIALLIVGRRGSRVEEPQTLTSKFGPEYDKAVQDSMSRARGHVNVREPQISDEHYALRELSATKRDHYGQWWTHVQTIFVERPAVALVEADRLTADLMLDRGYPVTDRHTSLESLTPRHAHLVRRLRRAHDLSKAAVSAEQMREALLDYRAVVSELLAVDLRTMKERQAHRGTSHDGY